MNGSSRTGVAVAAILAFFLLLALVWGVIYGVRWVTAEPKGALEAREQIKGSGTFRIAAYNHFYNLCAAVKSDEATIEALNQELATNPSEKRVGQINASITALRSGRAEKINQYNADASKDYTIGQFRSSNLPYQLDSSQEVTLCAI